MPSQPSQLPDELIVHILEKILRRSKTLEAYRILRVCALVCKQWAPIAREMLLTWTEVPTSQAALLLGERLQQLVNAAPGKSFIKTLAYGARPDHGYGELNRLLALDPGIRHLVICGGFTQTPMFVKPTNLSNLRSLTDVTLLSAIGPTHSPQFLLTFLPILPASVRFINIPQDTPYIRWNEDFLPAFSLYGLIVPSYPTAITDGILRRSRDSLQFLIVSTNLEPSLLAKQHPNLRSLKILDPFPRSHGDFSALKALERLELRWFIRTQGPLDWALPDSLQYIRLWGTPFVEDLIGLIADSNRLSNLRVVIWDWWFPDALEEARGIKIKERLKALCAQRNIDLRTYQRQTNPSKASVGKDVVYENALRQSCFDDGTPLSPPPMSKLPTRIARRIGGRPDPSLLNYRNASAFPQADFASSAAKHPRLLEECFDDYGE